LKKLFKVALQPLTDWTKTPILSSDTLALYKGERLAGKPRKIKKPSRKYIRHQNKHFIGQYKIRRERHIGLPPFNCAKKFLAKQRSKEMPTNHLSMHPQGEPLHMDGFFPKNSSTSGCSMGFNDHVFSRVETLYADCT